MQLHRLVMENVCQHEHLDWKFSPGLTGILGPNGSGKTNTMSIGCYGAFTNDFSRHALGKEGCPRQGSEGPFRTTLEFSHGGTHFVLTRGFRPATHCLEAGGRKITRDSEIEEEIRDILGITKTLLDNYVFVGQDELFAFIRLTEAKRAEHFTQLCQTQKAEKIWELLGEQIRSDSPLAEAPPDDSDNLRRVIHECKKEKRQAKEQLQEARRNLLSAADRRGLMEKLEQLKELRTLTAAIPQQEKQEGELKRRAVAAVKALREATQQAEQLQQALAEVRARAAAAEGSLAEYRAKRTAVAAAKDLQAQIRSLEANEPVAPECPEETAADVLQEECSQLRHQEEVLVRMTSSLTGVLECPVCGTPTDRLQDQLENAHKELPVVRKRVVIVSRRLKARAEYDKGTAAFHAARHRWEAKLATLQEQLKQPGPDTYLDDGAIPGWKADIAAREEAEERCDAAQQQRASAVRCREEAVARHKAVEADLAVRSKRLAVLSAEVDERQADGWKNALDASLAAEIAIARLDERISHLETTETGATEQMKAVRVARDRSCKAKGWLELLSQARDVCHRNNLPRVVHQTMLEKTEGSVNEILRGFGDPFRVAVDSNLSFLTRFRNGTEMPAAGLSGGQKVILALAFRLAINPVGLLVLDEPTAGLDAYHIDCMLEVFRRLGNLAENSGRQIIVITHDEALLPVFSRVYRLERLR